MGLDMYAFAAPARRLVNAETGVDVEVATKEDAATRVELAYWRKHPNLHGWMERLYREKGGAAEVFNVVGVRLVEADLDALQAAVESGALPPTDGFFFGKSDGSEKPDDLAFIAKAREAIKDGLVVYYTSWW